MKTINLNKIRSHFVTIASMASFATKPSLNLRSALHFRYSIVIPRFIHDSILIAIITTVFITLLTITTLLIVANHRAQCTKGGGGSPPRIV